jgi:hypothetical protein
MPSQEPKESIAEAFQREVAEVQARLGRGERLLGFALAIVIDEGRTVVSGFSLERHEGGLADASLRAELAEARAELDVEC